MGRKKKKQGLSSPPASLAASSSPPSASKNKRHQQDDADADADGEVAIVDCLPVRILARGPASSDRKSSGSSSSATAKPRVLLSAHDAAQLDVWSNEEEVFLLSFEKQQQPESAERDPSSSSSSSGGTPERTTAAAGRTMALLGAARLPVEIQQAGSTMTKSTSPRPLAPGTVRVTCSFLADRLLGSSTCAAAAAAAAVQEPQQSTATTPSYTATTPPRPPVTPSSASSSKANFSFNIGGGGDLLYEYTTPSPSSSRRSATKDDTPASSFRSKQEETTQVYIVPASAPLGQALSQSALCRPCQRLVLECGPTNREETANNIIVHSNNSNNRQRHLLLQRLVLAHAVRRHVQPDEPVRISVAGRPTEFRVVACAAAETATETLETRATNVDGANDAAAASLQEDLARLRLDDDSNDQTNHPTQRQSARENVLLAAMQTQQTHLYQIGYETAVEFRMPANGDPSVASASGAATAETTTATATPPPVPRPLAVGLDATLAECRALLRTPLFHPELFRTTRPPRGVLLHGPSGAGKSSLARQLADEIIRDSGSSSSSNSGSHHRPVDVEYVHCAALLSQTAVVGQAERQLARLFHRSSNNARLLVLDDLHLIGAKRGGRTVGADRLTATLLALMDGIGSTAATTSSTNTNDNSNAQEQQILMILGVTRSPSLLDAALRRPGRLDVEVEVPLPDDAATRAKILQFHHHNATAVVDRPGYTEDSTTNAMDWLELGKLAKGFNGADCLLAVKEAVRLSLLSDTNSAAAEKENAQNVVSFEHLRAAIRATKPSAIKSITVEIPQVHWSSIGGMDSVKRELREAIELPLTHSDYFEQLRVPPPRGVLLYGPPGCSKTLMARALATEGQMNFLAVKGPELLSKWLGESERALASLFRRARLASPSIIFFDELDAIASKRGSGGDSASSGRLLSQLLTELDGVNHPMGVGSGINGKKQRVVVVGATNRPDLLDPALTRPGRIDRKIYVGVPDVESRAQILKLSLQDRSCGDDIDVAQLARDSHGCSGAEMVAICRDAALLALEESDSLNSTMALEQPKIEMRHLISAMQDMQRQITPEMIDFYAAYGESSRRERFPIRAN